MSDSLAVDLTFSPENEAFRAEARAWLDAHVPADPLPSLDTPDGFEAHRAWEHTMFEDRWSVVSWPVEYGGRDVGLFEWLVFEEEYYRARAPKRVSQNGIFLLAPTMLEYGTEAQKARYLPPMAAGDEIWCQGWSEPDAGSDLAGIRSPRRTHRDGGRLGPQRPEDLGQPGCLRGVVLRHLPHRPRGRAPSRADLLPHRHGHARRHRAAHPPDRRRDRFRRDLLRQRRGPRGPGAGRGGCGLVGCHGHRRLRARALVAQPRPLHRGSRPPPQLYASRGGPAASADAVAQAHMQAEAYRLHTYWTATKVARGHAVGPEASANKIFWSETDVAIHTAALDLLGPEAELLRGGAPGEWLDGFLFSLAGPIYAGTNEIQRNVVGERLLGLPR